MGLGFWVLVFISNFSAYMWISRWQGFGCQISFLRFLGQKIFLPWVFGSQISFLRFLRQRIFLPLVFGS